MKGITGMATAPHLTTEDTALLAEARREVKSLREQSRRADRALARLEEAFLAELGISVHYNQEEN